MMLFMDIEFLAWVHLASLWTKVGALVAKVFAARSQVTLVGCKIGCMVPGCIGCKVAGCAGCTVV